MGRELGRVLDARRGWQRSTSPGARPNGRGRVRMPAGPLDRWLPVVLVVAWIVPIALLWARWGDEPDVAAAVDPAAADTTVAAATLPPADLVGEDPAAGGACVMTVRTVRLGDTGQSVQCVEQALVAKGRLAGSADGQFDATTKAAVEELQEEAEMFVDGVVGRETGLALGVWPDEAANVVRTPPPPPGALDLLGYPLSSVASAGADAPPLPENSGSGRRLVYERTGQRVWAVDEDERIIRSWLVSGSKYDNETPGTHEVYSRSDMSTAWNGKAWLPMMVRWLQTDIGHIGFHALPRHVEDDSPYQTEAELGTRLSGGCQRQADRDARFTWDFAQIGTKVVVI